MGVPALPTTSDDEFEPGRAFSDILSVKISTVFLALGAAYAVHKTVEGRRRRGQPGRQSVPPVPPQGWTSPAVGV